MLALDAAQHPQHVSGQDQMHRLIGQFGVYERVEDSARFSERYGSAMTLQRQVILGALFK